MKRVFKISDIIFEIEYKYRLANELLKEYLYEGETQPTEFISITDSDIEFEKQHAETFEPAVLEMGAILRKYAEICTRTRLYYCFLEPRLCRLGQCLPARPRQGKGKAAFQHS